MQQHIYYIKAAVQCRFSRYVVLNPVAPSSSEDITATMDISHLQRYEIILLSKYNKV